MANKSIVEDIVSKLRTYRVWMGLGLCIFLGTLALEKMSFSPVNIPSQSFGFGYLTIGILLIVLSFIIKAGTWFVLLKPVSKIGFFGPFSSILVGHLIDNAFGIRIGELMRAVALGLMEDVSIVSALVTVVLYRIIDGAAILLFVLLVSGFVTLPSILLQGSALGLLSCLVILGLLVIARTRNKWFSLPAIMSSQSKGTWLRKRYAEVLRGLGSLGSWKDIMAVFLLSLLTRLAIAGYYWSVGRALGFNLPPYSPLALMGLLYYRRFIPTPALSTYERTVTDYLGMGEASQGILESYAILSYSDMYLITTAIGLFILLISSFRKLKSPSMASVESLMVSKVLHPLWMAVWVFTLGGAFYQGFSYVQDQAFIGQKAAEITVGLKTDDEKVSAVVKYLKDHVKRDPLAIFNIDRPFLRYDAREVLTTGNAYCGEGVRTLVKLLDSLGIQARRLNIYGPRPHVVAEVFLNGRWVVVDPQVNDFVWPKRKGGITLKEILETRLYGWNDYSTLNLRRLGLAAFLGSPTRIKSPLPPVIAWIQESPHLIKMLVYAGLFCISLMWWFVRRWYRR